MTSRMWSCFGSFISLKHLTISDSSLSFHPSAPELPSVTKLSAEKVTSQCYESLISLLPGLEDIDITIDDAEGDIAHITAGLRRTVGQKLKRIYLHGLSSLPPEMSRVSRETMRGLGLILNKHTQNLQELHLEGVKCTDENDLVYLLECCRRVRTMKCVSLTKCWTMTNGGLRSRLERLHRETSERLYVDVCHEDGNGLFRYCIPTLSTEQFRTADPYLTESVA
nr:uncharacterized protein LOC129263469 [Lytechinus pictus]